MPKRQLPLQAELVINRLRWGGMIERHPVGSEAGQRSPQSKAHYLGQPARQHQVLLLLGVQPPLTTSLLWRLVKAAVFVGHT